MSDQNDPLWTNPRNSQVAPLNAPGGGPGAGSFGMAGSLGAGPNMCRDLPHHQSPSFRLFDPTQLIEDQCRVTDPAWMNAPTGDAGVPAEKPHKLLVSGVVVAGGPLNNATIDLVNEASKTETNKRYIAYETLVKVGGSLAWRANNPGNLRWAGTQIGSVPGAVGNFAVFATMEAGRAAQKTLYLTTYGTMTVRAAVGKLTPESENDTPGYLRKLKAAGIDLDKDVNSQIDLLMTAIKNNEGMIDGHEVTRAN
jgi:hypothetical protein